MRIPKFLVLLLVIIVTGYTLLPLIYAYPQAVSQRNPLPNSVRSKRNIFDEALKVGKSVVTFGDDVLKEIKRKFNFQSRTFALKDAERLCRLVKGPPSKYNVLCLEDMGNSLFLNYITNAVSQPGKKAKTTTTTTTTPKPWAKINIDVVFARPTSTTKKPTTTPIPFDWPGFILQVFNLTQDSLNEFEEKIKSEMNKLADRSENSNVSHSIVAAAKGIEKIGNTFDSVDKKIGTVAKSIDSVNEGVQVVGHNISTAVNQSIGSLQGSLDLNFKDVNTAIQAGSGKVATSIDKSTAVLEASIANSTKLLVESQNNDKLLQILEDGLKSVNMAIQNGSVSLESSLQAGVDIMTISLQNATEYIEKSIQMGTQLIGKSVNGSAAVIEDSMESFKQAIEAAAFKGLSKIEKSLNSGIEDIQIVIQSGSKDIKDALEKLAKITPPPIPTAAPFDFKGVEAVLDRNMMSIVDAINSSSIILDTMADILKLIHQSLIPGFFSDDMFLSTKIQSSLEQSEILNEINDILENIITDPYYMSFDRDSLSMHVTQFADSVLANNDTRSFGLEMMKIAEEISNIDTEKQDALEILGIQIEKFGAVKKDMDEIFSQIKTGELFENIGTLMKELPKYQLNHDSEETTDTGVQG